MKSVFNTFVHRLSVLVLRDTSHSVLHHVIQEGLRHFLAVTYLLSAEERVEFQGSACGICGVQSGTRRGFP